MRKLLTVLLLWVGTAFAGDPIAADVVTTCTTNSQITKQWVDLRDSGIVKSEAIRGIYSALMTEAAAGVVVDDDIIEMTGYAIPLVWDNPKLTREKAAERFRDWCIKRFSPRT